MGLRDLIRETPLWYALAKMRFWMGSSQSNEVAILDMITAQVLHPKTFVEFGYHYSEFNCIKLAKTYRGLVIDGDETNVRRSSHILPAQVEVRQMWITLDNLQLIRDRFKSGDLGILSVDVDGNDFWFLKSLLPLKPSIVSVEYNASFGRQSVSAVYDPHFMRFDKHPSGNYHGASLAAMTKLCADHDMDLVAVSSQGINAFFVRSELRPASLPKLDPASAYRESSFRNTYNNSTAEQQWQAIQDMPLVQI